MARRHGIRLASTAGEGSRDADEALFCGIFAGKGSACLKKSNTSFAAAGRWFDRIGVVWLLLFGSRDDAKAFTS
jgi:hypothetical protein